MTDLQQVEKKDEKVYRELPGPDGETMRVRIMPPDAAVEELETAVIEDTTVAMTDEQAELLDEWLEQGVRDGRAV